MFVFEIEAPKEVDALFTAGSLASTPDKCTNCQSEDVELEGTKAKGYTFVKVVCKKCGFKAQLGQYKEGGVFWKKFQNYEQDDQGNA